MNHQRALEEIKKHIGKGKRFRTQTEMAEHLGVEPSNVNAVFTGARPKIPDNMLAIANLQRVKHPDTYIKKQDAK